MARKHSAGRVGERVALGSILTAAVLAIYALVVYFPPDDSDPVERAPVRARPQPAVVAGMDPEAVPGKELLGVSRPARDKAPDAGRRTQAPNPAPTSRRDLPLNEGRTFTKVVLAEGLVSPDGIAIHPLTGKIYVSEEDVGRITMLDDGSLRVVIDRQTPIVHENGDRLVRGDPLTFPEAIVFCGEGALYVAEDVPDGRLIRFAMDETGGYPEGRNIEIPGSWPGYAWEGLDIGPEGEILLAGSDLEWATRQDAPVPFGSVMLYRDAQAQWWVISRQPFTSYSESRFSNSGQQVVYTCEATGAIGWMNLVHRSLRGYSAYAGHSPEGVALLPDGSFLVAEEASGSIVHICPATDRHEHIVEGLQDIESVLWDEAHQRILVTEDGTGRLLAFGVNKPYDRDTDAFDHALYYPGRSPRVIPETCPEYLARILAFGGLDYVSDNPHISFREFATRVPMVAADMLVEPMNPDRRHGDPIERVQFVVFEPNRLVREDHRPDLAFALFGLRKQSGRYVTSRSLPVAIRGVRLPGRVLRDQGSGALVVPLPSAVHTSGAGIVSIHFLGLGRMPDYSLVLNPPQPNNSYMVVYHGDGSLDHYRLIKPGPEDEENWVISYARSSRDQWVRADVVED